MFFPLAMYSQSPNRFNKLYDENNLWQGFAAATEKSDNNYLLAGVNLGFAWSDFYIWNCIVNQQGDTIANHRIKSGDSSTYYIGFGALIREDKCFYLAGTQELYDNQIQYADGYLMKLDEKGNRLWQKNYGGLNYEALDALVMTSDKELILAGQSLSFGDSVWGDIYVIKTDTAGEVIWENTFGEQGFPERCWGMDTTADGGFVLTGAEGFLFGGQNIFVMKITADGEVVWKKIFGIDDKDEDAYPRVRTLKNGDILFTTALYVSANTPRQAYIARLSPSGETLWEKYYPGTDWATWFGFATETPDGALVNAGAIMEPDPNYPNYYVVLGALTKTDAQGELIWQRKYYTRHDMSNYFFGMAPTSDAGFLMCGTAFRPGNNRQDAWAVKVDSLGCLEPGCAGSVVAAEPGTAVGLKVWPNPAADWLTVEAGDGILLGLRLRDMSGRTVEDVQFFRQHALREHRLSLAALPPGVYVLSVRTDKGWASVTVVKK